MIICTVHNEKQTSGSISTYWTDVRHSDSQGVSHVCVPLRQKKDCCGNTETETSTFESQQLSCAGAHGCSWKLYEKNE